MRQKNLLLLLMGLLLLVSLGLSACGSQDIYLCPDGSIAGGEEIHKSKVVYHCPSGTLAEEMNYCSFTTKSNILEDDARDNALNFVKAYVSADSWKVSLINVYSENSSWLAQIVVSKRDEQPYETKVLVDGKTGSVSCLENCFYIPN